MNLASRNAAAGQHRLFDRLVSFLLVICLLCSNASPLAAALNQTYCGLDHEHTLACYSNPNADLESASDWEQTLPETLSGVWSKDLLAVVQSQLGYQESTLNFLVGTDGTTTYGYNRYGAWYSSFLQDETAAYADWNITFLFFSLYYAGISDLPLEETAADWTKSLAAYSLYKTTDYTPIAGDLAFLDVNNDNTADRVGVVSTVSGGNVTVIEGDLNGAVAETSYALTDILGYGDMTQAQLDADPNFSIDMLNNTTFTIYFAAPASWTSYTIKANVCRSNGENNWQTVTMTNTGKTYTTGGTTYYLYSASVTEIYGGFDQIQFQRYSGTSWQEQYVAASSWVTKDTINGKIYINGTGWVTYAEDSTTPDTGDWAAGDKLYLDMSEFTDWTSSSATFYVYYYGSTYAMTKISDTLYSFDVTADMLNHSSFRFVRMDSSGTTWWNATDVLEWPTDGNNCYHITGWGSTDEGVNNGYWTTYDGGTGGGGSAGGTIDPDLTGETRKIYFDATLSKLSYNVSSNNGNATIPMSSGNNEGSAVYVYFWNSATDGSGSITMTKVAEYTSGNNKWADVYVADIPADAENVIFYSSSAVGTFPSVLSAQTEDLTVPSASEVALPCFYADTSDKCLFDGTARGGYWDEVFAIRDAEAGKDSDVVDIANKTFSANTNALYLSTTFFDWYSDYELNGNNRDTYLVNNGASYQNWVTFRQLNQALSDYYEVDSVKYPLYVGHFQPNYNFYDFKDIADTLDLYGYSSTNRFFASNNSVMDEGGTYDKIYMAMQGLVSDTLVDGKLMSHGGKQVFPLFDKDFVQGQNSKNTVLGQVYDYVSFPFTKQAGEGGVDYWTFDSSKTSVAMKYDTATGEYYLEDVGSNPNWSHNVDVTSNPEGKGYGFFPFNETSSATHANTYNYGFGVRIDLTFRLTADGKIDGNDIVFQFSGDDDVWVFIDGKLALDVGGAHGAVSGNLNFATKQATVDNVKYGGSATTQYAPRTTSFTMEGSNTDQHTLTMFYIERGMWESNMKITFNFPDENLLDVKKEVDDSEVNDLFDGVFDNQALFTFNIKNLATHYGTKLTEGQTYTAPVIDPTAATYQASYSGNSFSLLDSYADASNVIQWYAELNDDSSEWRHRRYGVMTLPSAISIANMRNLSFYIYTDDGTSLDDLYLQFVDADASASDLVIAASGDSNDVMGYADANAAGTIGSSSTFAAKTYGTPDVSVGGSWVKVTLDLSKLDTGSSFDETRVKYIRFGSDVGENIYLYGFEFEPMAEESVAAGFVTEQYDIPDYGSATSGVLEIPEGAIYSSSVDGKSYLIGADGVFVLENDETVSFHDQFRRGSYIYLEEVMSEQAKVLFDTTWTMYENHVPVTSFGAATSVITNPSTTPDMSDVALYYVRDNRVEKVLTGTTDGNAMKNAYTSTSKKPANSFVFRSYADPDNTTVSAKLKVVFKNKVNVGSLTISNEQTPGSDDLTGSYTYYVEFYNVGGLGLESETIITSFTLKVGESYTIDGIPLGTEYRIHEVKPTDGSTLDYVTEDSSQLTVSSGTVTYEDSSYDTFYVTGKISDSSNTSDTFYNSMKPVISMTVTKSWANTTSETEIPGVIYLQLQRRAGTSGSYSVVSGYEKVALQGGYTGWSYTFDNLDQYNNYTSSSKKLYYYQVREVDADGNVISSGSTLNGIFTVTYGTASRSSSTGNFTQTITNTWIPTASLSITKTIAAGADSTWSGGTFQMQVTLGGELLSVGTAYTIDGTAYRVTTEGVITLSGGQTAVITGIPAGTEFEVTELDSLTADYQPVYTGTVTASGGTVTNLTSAGTSISGTCTSGSEARVTVTNRNRGNHVVVIDFGLPVDVTVLNDDFAALNGSLAGISSTNGSWKTSSYGAGHGTVSISSNKVRYTPTDMELDEAVTIYYRIRYTENGSTKYYISTVTIIPATIIYYEDSTEFVTYTNGKTTGSNTHGTWGTIGTVDSDAVQAEDRPGLLDYLDANNIYGYDNDEYLTYKTYSQGQAHQVTVSAYNNPNSEYNTAGKTGGTWPTASFTFTGTGFDVISLTNSNSGMITVQVKNTAGNVVVSYIVDNYYGYTYSSSTGTWTPAPSDSSELYQIPVIKVEGLTYGTYTATITAMYADRYDHDGSDGEGNGQYSFWLDAIRVYDPAGNKTSGLDSVVSDAYIADNELYPTYCTVKSLLVSANDFNSTITKDDAGNTINGVVFIDGRGNIGGNNNLATYITTYNNAGPNNETYLKSNQGVAFKLQTTSKPNKVHLAMKLADGDSASVVITASGHPTAGTVTANVTTATDLYYDISDLLEWTTTTSGGTTYYVTEYPITVLNTSSSSASILSLTNLKCTFSPATTRSAGSNGDYTIQTLASNEIAAAAYSTARQYMTLTSDAFVPETFGASFILNQVSVGAPAALTIRTSADVASVTVNGEAAVLLRTDSATGERIWTYAASTAQAGEYTYHVVAFNENGTASDPLTVTLTVTDNG